MVRLRATIYEQIYFQKRIAKLGPAYLSCNERQSTCTRKKAKPRQGCPDCEYTIKTNEFQKDLANKLDRLPKTTRRGMRMWPKDKMVRTASEIASLSFTTKGTNPRWPVTTQLFVSIYRDEIAKMKAVESYRIEQEAEAERAKAESERTR